MFEEKTTSPDPLQPLAAFRRRHPPQRRVVAGTEWLYWELGRGLQTLVFLHGMAGSGDVWFQQLLHFARTYRVIAPTYPPVQPLERLTKGVWELLDGLGVRNFQLVGSSLGGLAAQRMASERPGRVERVVFGNTFPPAHTEILRGRWMLRLAQWMPGRTPFLFMRRALSARGGALEAGERLARAYLLEQFGGGMSREQFFARAACVYSDFELAPPAMPHAIVESLDDVLLGRELRADLKRLYPRAWVYTFKKGGHFPYLSQPEEYNRALVAFLNASFV